MQEDQTVSFEPMYVDGDQRWVTKLFVLYLLIVLVMFLIRAIILAADLRKLRIAQMQVLPARVSDGLWSDLYSTVRSFKDFPAITFLLALLNFTWCAADDLLSIRAVKVANVGYVLARIGEELAPLETGLILCILLYSAAMLSQAVLRRRRAASSALDVPYSATGA
jgi:hypothetical protein